MTLVVDPWHWLLPDGSIPLAPRGLRRNMLRVARVIEYGAPLAPGERRETLIECSLRPNRVPCPGLLDVARNNDGSIIAGCPACGDVAMLVHNWQNTPWAQPPQPPSQADGRGKKKQAKANRRESDENRSKADLEAGLIAVHPRPPLQLLAGGRKKIAQGEKVPVRFDAAEKKLIRDLTMGDEYADRLQPEGSSEFVGRFTLDDLDDLLGHIAAEANHTKDRKAEVKLYRLFDRLQAELQSYGDGD